MHFWLETSLRRIYPLSPAGRRSRLSLQAPRGGRVSWQIGIRNDSSDQERKISVSVGAPESVQVRVRRVGFVPVAHLNTGTPPDELDGIGYLPGLAPDPLFDEQETVLGPLETQSFWASCEIPPETKPGSLSVRCRVAVDGKQARTLEVRLSVSPVSLPRTTGLMVGHWFYADAISDRHGLELYSNEFWPVAERYMADYLGHGNNTMFVPHLTPPINGEHHPSQLLRVERDGSGGCKFDFSNVQKWVRMAKALGATHFFWSHLFTQWGAKNAARVFLDNGDAASSLWPSDTPATSEVYRAFLDVYLPALREFMEREHLLKNSFVQMSDEPFNEEALANYRAAKQMVRQIAPWTRAMDGLSDVRFASEGLCEMPIAGLGSAEKFAEGGYPHCVYYCCGPRGRWLNRLIDTPLVKIRMTGWLLRKLKASGFMHWGYNYWYRGCTPELLDPYQELAYGEWPFIPYGDPFVVYPGSEGPIDSIRWEVFADSMADYRLLEAAGVDANNRLLAPIRSYEEFPKREAWVKASTRKLLGTSEDQEVPD